VPIFNLRRKRQRPPTLTLNGSGCWLQTSPCSLLGLPPDIRNEVQAGIDRFCELFAYDPDAAEWLREFCCQFYELHGC
jgi:hypothetical protein